MSDIDRLLNDLRDTAAALTAQIDQLAALTRDLRAMHPVNAAELRRWLSELAVSQMFGEQHAWGDEA